MPAEPVMTLRGVAIGFALGAILLVWAAAVGVLWAVLRGRLDRWWRAREDRAVRRVRERDR